MSDTCKDELDQSLRNENLDNEAETVITEQPTIAINEIVVNENPEIDDDQSSVAHKRHWKERRRINNDYDCFSCCLYHQHTGNFDTCETDGDHTSFFGAWYECMNDCCTACLPACHNCDCDCACDNCDCDCDCDGSD